MLSLHFYILFFYLLNMKVKCERVGFQELYENVTMTCNTRTSQLKLPTLPTPPSQPQPSRAHKKKNNKYCNVCGKCFSSVVGFKQHMNKFHYPEDELSNIGYKSDLIFTHTLKPTCKTYWIKNRNIFEDFENLLDTDVINEEYSCKICYIFFSSLSEYNEHEGIHFINAESVPQESDTLDDSDDILEFRIHFCDVCPRHFSDRQELDIHIAADHNL